MIEHVYRRAAEARGVDGVVVATDDPRVLRAVESFGGIARMTGCDHSTGTDRIAEIARDLRCHIVVNVQGDEPLVDPAAITEMIDALHGDPTLEMSTLRTPLVRDEDYLSPHVVKVVVDRDDNALYFSRAPIPFYRSGPAEAGHHDDGEASDYDRLNTNVVSGFRRTAYKHLGLYAYRRDFLLRLASLPPTPLERAESLEQLRALEYGFRVRAVETRYDSIGVDTPDDLERVRQARLAGPKHAQEGAPGGYTSVRWHDTTT